MTASPAVAIVEGESGIGKTRLIRELILHPDLHGRRPLVGQAHRIREPFPLGSVIEAIRGVGTSLSAAALSPVTGALRPLLPELSSLLPEATEPLDDAVAERHRVFRGLAELIDAVSPAVLVVEDLHWADEQTGDFLKYVLARPSGQLTVVLTCLPEMIGPRMRAVATSALAGSRVTRVALPPLDVQQTGALAAQILGIDDVSNEFATYLRERTGGVPLAIEELLALLRARGDVVRRDGRWSRRVLDHLDVPTGIRNHVLERVDRLGEAAREAVQAAAILQLPVDVSVLAALCEAGRERVLRGLEEALGAGLLTASGSTVAVRHPMAAQAVYDAIFPPRREDLHSRAATALRVLDPVPLGRIAHHLRQAGRVEEWVKVAEQAADQASELRHDVEAARLLEEVLRFATLQPEQRGRIAVKLGTAALEAERTEDIIDLVKQTLRQGHDLPAAVRGELRLQLALLLEHTGTDSHLLRPLLVDAVEDLAERPELMAWAMIGLGILIVEEFAAPEYIAWVKRALSVLPDIQDPVFEGFLKAKAAEALMVFGDAGWRRLSDDFLRQTAAPRHSRELSGYLSIGEGACFTGHFDVANRTLTVGVDAAAAVEHKPLELRGRARMALLDYLRSAWDGLSGRAEGLVDQLAGYAPGRLEAEAVAACLTLARGELDEAYQRLTDTCERTQRRGGFDLLPIPAGALIRLMLARGQTDVETRARSLLSSAEQVGLWVPTVRALPAMVEAIAVCGDVRAASGLVNRYEAELRTLDAPLAVAALAHARGLLEVSCGMQHAAASHLTEAADGYERAGCLYEAAQAHERAAAVLLEAGVGDRHQNVALLGVAIATYQTLGAEWDLGRASRIAREHGVTVPARHRGGRHGYGDALSPRQRDVAKLAAMGRTNKEIAAELYLSPSTVSQHLVATMKKIGVNTRAALASRLVDNGKAD